MADSEECRLKRIKHEQHLSRVFDEVMGLGDFADSSRGSATSSRSEGQEEMKEVDETSGQGEHPPVEDDSNSSKQEEKMDEGEGKSSFPCNTSRSLDRHSSFTMGTNEGGGSGGAAFDDALDGLPAFGPEEEDEDWHFALPMGSLEDAEVGKRKGKRKRPREENNKTQKNPFPLEPTEEEEEREREGSSASANTSHSSQDHTPENSRDAAVLNQTEETEDSQHGERSEAAATEDSNPPMSPTINIKDEPIDEGYDAALLPQGSIRQIKEELDTQEEELRISSVYSVGGGNSFVSPAVPAAIPAPPPAAIFIPGRGAILQAMAPLPVKPPAPVQSPLQALSPVPPRPPQPPIPGSVRCSGCSKVLLKGQTAFQRKGSTQLFCSTVCLTGHLPPANKNRSCFQCNREILQPRDMITIPGDDGNYMHFCSQFCLSIFRDKKKQTDKAPDKRLERKSEKPHEKQVERQPDKIVCSVCRVAKRIEHEVSHQGRLHRLCSDGCFVSWRKIRHLAMNCCEGCGLYCNSNSGSCHTLTIERSSLNFCGPTCIGTYKQSCRKTVECAYCHKTVIASTTIMERDQKGKIQLYCSPVCVEKSRPPQHTLTGAAFPCCLCKVSAVPQYHLAMVDGTIRNFCSYVCVSIYRKSGITSQPTPADLTNGISPARDPYLREAPRQGPSAGASSVPQDYPSSVPCPSYHPSNTAVPPLVPPYPVMSSPSVPGQTQARTPSSQLLKPGEGEPSDHSKLSCHQCNKQLHMKPLLFSHQGHISLFCSKTCCEQYKIQKNILAVCECCKQEKVVFETISYNQVDLFFCSENCKQVFKTDVTSRNHPWRPCSYCSSISQKMLHSHYGGRMEEFCRPHCMSQYTVLYYGMGRCDSCRKQAYLTEKLQCLGSVRNFCDLPCLLGFCILHFEAIQHTSRNGTGTAPQTPHAPAQPHHSSKMNPVIADVVSLANGSATQPSVSADTALTGSLPTSSIDGKNLDHASTQTDAMRLPAPRRRQMKNKSVLCRPFTSDQEIMCSLPTPSSESAALIDSSSQPDRPSADASTSPAPSPKPQEETQLCNGLPARLTGRHFLGKRDTDFACKVCSHYKRKRAKEEEEEEQERKRQKMQEEEMPEKRTVEETEDAKGVNLPCDINEERKQEEHSERTNCEQKCETMTSLTAYYCRTCSGEPSLCPVPCFEFYHTRLIYKTVPPETQALSPPSVGCSVESEKVKVVMVPVPVPIFIPVPMNMYSQLTPVPMAMPVPVPVPIVVPPQDKDVSDAAVQSEPLDVKDEKQNDKHVSSPDHSGDTESHVVTPIIHKDEENPKAAEAPPPPPVSSDVRAESAPDPQQEESPMTCDPPTTSAEHQPPSSPMMDLETDFPSEPLVKKPGAPQRGVKRQREGFTSRKRGRRRVASVDRSAVVSPPASSNLNHLYGVKAWRSWVQQCNKQPKQPNPEDFKEDILQCDSAQLSFALSRFVKEVRRPNGETYSPDSILYLCLGIQQYLFMKGRIENIFTDELYGQFATEITGMLQLWKPKQLPRGGVISSRVQESFLWECKQLGAYSPIVLLNTVLFFCTRNFHLTTLAQHQNLSFSNLNLRSKPCSRAGKVHYLQYQRSCAATPGRGETERLRKRQEQTDGDLEMQENVANPLHCPVRLYEFYLSRCPETVKKRTDMFYLQPERNVHTHSSHWYTAQPLERTTLQSMLTRILAVKEVHRDRKAAQHQSSATTKVDSLQ